MATTRKKAEPDAAPPVSFEEAMARLTAIVEQLESGDLELEESLARFEEGVRLARSSQARLDAAEQRVDELLRLDANGEPVTEPLEEP
ncbi:MAG TPA: exodeoxyribonuclease VII small subunit [Polyangiaceae bacterium]|nr:exodeoxyribonuclease VII small subunit [Polyangiaceae bacterium]